MSRSWCGPNDPDPTVVQIGAVRVSLTEGLPIDDTKTIYVIPKDRKGQRCPLDPFFTELTGVTEQDIDLYGVPLQQALEELSSFAGDSILWAWGHDDRTMMALSCYIEGIAPNIPATQFENAARILLRAGMPYDDLVKTNSGRLAKYFDLPEAETISEHDGLSDALSITYAMQHLEREGKLDPLWLSETMYSV
ncbi:MAG: exonuclease [Bdellovibrionales bacterium]